MGFVGAATSALKNGCDKAQPSEVVTSLLRRCVVQRGGTAGEFAAMALGSGIAPLFASARLLS
jgi:hypothetical protein